jgi:regulator of RNase E activity RraA
VPLSPETRRLLAQIGIPTLANALLKRGLRNQVMQDVHLAVPGVPRMVGEAYTLRFIPAREDIDTMAAYASPQHKQRRAIEECPAGHVLVIDSRGDARAAAAGDLLIGRLKARGCAGIVTDGGYRDMAGVMAVGLPAFQRRPAPPASPIVHHPEDLDVAIGCGGVAVYPRDVIVGDIDGVVVIPAHLADEVAAEAYETMRYEEFAEAMIAAGRSIYGLFPPTPESRQEYDAWRLARGD